MKLSIATRLVAPLEPGPERVPAFEGLYSGGLANLKQKIEAH